MARLAEGDATVGQLAEPYQMTLQAVYSTCGSWRTPGSSAAAWAAAQAVRLETGVLTEMETWIERYRRRAEQRYRRLDALLATMSHTDDKDGADDVNGH